MRGVRPVIAGVPRRRVYREDPTWTEADYMAYARVAVATARGEALPDPSGAWAEDDLATAQPDAGGAP